MPHLLRTGLATALAALLIVPATAAAQDNPDGWSGTGELGFSTSRGNARSDNLNARLAFRKEDEQWRHRFSLAGLRARGEVTADFDGDGEPETRLQLTANRYQAAASSALKMNERASWVSALRYERDDFSAYEWQGTVSIGYGYQYIDTERVKLGATVGPGYRRARNASTLETESEGILRGSVEYAHQLTTTTRLENDFLVESGSDNTFIQNDLGLSVAINSALALKAGFQVRRNSEVDPGREKTDTLTTLNVVYTFF